MAVLGLVVVAVVKPWAGTGPTRLPPAAPTALATAVATATLAPPGPTAAPALTGVAAIDMAAVGAVLQPHDAWGIRTVVYRTDNTVREDWTPLLTSEPDVRGAVNNAESYAVLSAHGAVVALGVTTPLGDLPLDVRVWRDAAGSPAGTSGWRNLALTGSTPSGDPTTRLLRLPAESSGDSVWPAAEYQLDILLEHGVLHAHLWLSGQAGPFPAAPAPRPAPAVAQIQALAGTPGAFIESGTATQPYLFSGLPPTAAPHDEFDAWLAFRSNHIFWAPGLYEPQAPVLGTANLVGVSVPVGQALISAELTEIAPVSRDLGAATLLPGLPNENSRRNAIAVFHPDDPGTGFPDAVYRIDAKVETRNGQVAMSWDVPALARPSSTVSFLLAADRAWPSVPVNGWTVLAPGHRTRLTPAGSTDLPGDPGPGCQGGANVGPAPWYVGVAHPGADFSDVVVWHLSGSSQLTPLETQKSQLVPGFVTIRPLASDWETGRYQVIMFSGPKVQAVTVCVQ